MMRGPLEDMDKRRDFVQFFCSLYELAQYGIFVKKWGEIIFLAKFMLIYR